MSYQHNHQHCVRDPDTDPVHADIEQDEQYIPRGKRQRERTRKRKPKRQGSRNQTGKKLPPAFRSPAHHEHTKRVPVRNNTCKLSGADCRCKA